MPALGASSIVRSIERNKSFQSQRGVSTSATSQRFQPDLSVSLEQGAEGGSFAQDATRRSSIGQDQDNDVPQMGAMASSARGTGVLLPGCANEPAMRSMKLSAKVSPAPAPMERTNSCVSSEHNRMNDNEDHFTSIANHAGTVRGDFDDEEPSKAEDVGRAGEKASGEEAASPNVTEKRWKKLRIAAKLSAKVKVLQDDIRVYGVEESEDGPPDDPNDPRFAFYKASLVKKWYILLPTSAVRRAWELLVVFALLYVVIIVPLRVCFNSEATGGAAAFDWFIDSVFIVDVVVNCFCAYQMPKTGELVVNQRDIVVHYARTWMLLDVVASVPFYQFIAAADTDLAGTSANDVGQIARLPRLVKLVRMLRLLKLLRVVKLFRYMNNWETSVGINVAYTRMFKVGFGVFMVTHFIGCGWYFIAAENDASWVTQLGVQDSDDLTKYIASVYWSFSTLTTVGFGDISAQNNSERLFSILCMVVGVSWYAFVISTISSIIGMFDRKSAEVKRKQRLIVQFMRETNMPWGLRRRILSYFDYVTTVGHNEMDGKEMESVLSLLSTQLRTEVTLHVHRHLIPEVPFFHNKTPQFQAACASLLKPLKFQAGDYISTRGQHADEMYFLLEGRAVVILPDGKKFKSILAGSYFGEIGCLLSEVHKVSIVAVGECEIYALGKNDLKELMCEYPDVAHEIRSTATKRIEHLNSSNGNSQKRGPENGDVGLATSFPGMSFSDESPEQEGETRQVLQSMGGAFGAMPTLSGGRSSMIDDWNGRSASNSADEGGASQPAVDSQQLKSLESAVQLLQEENKALSGSVDDMKATLAQMHALMKEKLA